MVASSATPGDGFALEQYRLAQPEVTKLYNFVGTLRRRAEKDVLRLEIPVEQLLLVNVFETICDLASIELSLQLSNFTIVASNFTGQCLLVTELHHK